MKMLTLTQPWATLVAIGAKRIETRSWGTPYRGPIAIHAAKGLNGLFPGAVERDLERVWGEEPFYGYLHDAGYAQAGYLPRGAIVAVADLIEIVRFPEGALRVAQHGAPSECDFGNYGPGRYGWLLDNVRRVKVECRGGRGLQDVPPEIAEQLLSRAENGQSVPE